MKTEFTLPPYSPEWVLEAVKIFKTGVIIPPHPTVERCVRAKDLVKNCHSSSLYSLQR